MVEETSPAAFLTIGALAKELGLPQHILRYWETRFPQLRPLTRAGNRRYYRQADADLARKIDQLLNHQGYSFKGVQQLLASSAPAAPLPVATKEVPPAAVLPALKAIRSQLAAALVEDRH
jgi:DNA-binding transcriptional MerR regulator